MDTLEAIDLAFLTELVELDDWQCGDRNHPAGVSFHTADMPAEFMIVGPCCGDRGLLCRSRAFYLRHMAATIHCMKCDRHWSPDRYRFVPLPWVCCRYDPDLGRDVSTPPGDGRVCRSWNQRQRPITSHRTVLRPPRSCSSSTQGSRADPPCSRRQPGRDRRRA